MQQDAAFAQASTLLTWADEWARAGVSGGTEVAFLLQRASGTISRCIGSPNLAIEASYADTIPVPDPVETIRSDFEPVAPLGATAA